MVKTSRRSGEEEGEEKGEEMGDGERVWERDKEGKEHRCRAGQGR